MKTSKTFDKKRIVITALVIVSVLVIVGVIMLICFINFSQNQGVQKISLSQKSENLFSLTVKCFGGTGYKVCNVDEDEKVLYGESYKDYDGSIGEYRIKIVIHDIAYDADGYNEKLIEKYTPFTAHNLAEGSSPLKMMWVYDGSHGIEIYIGSDKPLTVTEGEYDMKSISKIKVEIKQST